MKILFLSAHGEAGDIALRMSLDGHKVRLWIENPKMKDNMDGLVPKVIDWRQSIPWADLVVFDYNTDGLAKIWTLINKSVPVFGGSPFGNKIESDRAYGRSIMKMCGLPSLESHSYKTIKEAINHLKTHQVAHAVKPCGKNCEKHHLVIGNSKDNSDAILQLEKFIDEGLQVDSVEIEERKFGVEVGISRFFNGIDWVGPVNTNYEEKLSHDNGVGFLTGEVGSVCKYSEDPNLPLFEETLAKVKPILQMHDYRGQIDINCIVGMDGDKRFVAPLEWTPRIGFPAFALEDAVHVTPWEQIFHACATRKPLDMKVHYDWSVGVILCAFGFPFDDKVEKISKGLVVEGIDEHNIVESIHPMNMRLNKRGQFVVSSGQGYTLIATGRDSILHEAKRKAYAALSHVKLPNGYHRFGISDKISLHELDDLKILPLDEAIA